MEPRKELVLTKTEKGTQVRISGKWSSLESLVAVLQVISAFRVPPWLLQIVLENPDVLKVLRESGTRIEIRLPDIFE